MAYASWGKRVGGYLVDVFFAGVPALIGIVAFQVSADEYGQPTSVGLAIYLLGLAITLGLSIYNRWFLGGRTGQTWGRKVVKTRMVSERTGEPIGAGKAFLRDLCHYVDGLPCYVGWLFPLWDAKRQTFADKIMTTVVVEAGSAVPSAALVGASQWTVGAGGAAWNPATFTSPESARSAWAADGSPKSDDGSYRVCIRQGCVQAGTPTTERGCPACQQPTQARG